MGNPAAEEGKRFPAEIGLLGDRRVALFSGLLKEISFFGYVICSVP